MSNAVKNQKPADRSRGIVITIDGPAGAGKSTVARELARRLGFQYLNTGAMYRAATLAAIRQGRLDDPPDRLADFVRSLSIQLEGDRVFLNGEDVTDEIRRRDVTELVKKLANTPAVREVMVSLQRAAARGKNVVAEGRDQGSVVFPDAVVKFFLTADIEERARRRLRDHEQLGESLPLEVVIEEIKRRDEADRNRDVGPLVIPSGAVVIDTTNMSVDEVVNRMLAVVRERLGPLPSAPERSV